MARSMLLEEYTWSHTPALFNHAISLVYNRFLERQMIVLSLVRLTRHTFQLAAGRGAVVGSLSSWGLPRGTLTLLHHWSVV